MHYVNIMAYATDYVVVTLMVYEIYAKVLYIISSCVTSYFTSWCRLSCKSKIAWIILKFLQIISECLHPAPSPGRAAWSLFLIWMEDQGTWWSLLTEQCAYRSLPCKKKDEKNILDGKIKCFVCLHSLSIFPGGSIFHCCVYICLGFSKDSSNETQTWGQCLQPGWC